jgi:hypothetical protein
MSQTARKQADPRAQCWRGAWRCAVSYVEEIRTQARDVAPGAELVLVLPVLVPIMTVRGSKLGYRLPVICTSVVTGFPPRDSSAADRNWFRGNSLLSCVVRSMGGEQQK